MKEEYKTELKSILELLESKDNESRLLGISLFLQSKWVKDIKTDPDYENIIIQDYNGNGFWDNTEYVIDYFSDLHSSMSFDSNDVYIIGDLIRSLLDGTSKIALIEVLKEYS